MTVSVLEAMRFESTTMTCGITNTVNNEMIKSVVQFFSPSSLCYILLSSSVFQCLTLLPFSLSFSLCISSTFSTSHFHPFLLFIYLLTLDLHSLLLHLFSLAASLSLSIFPPLSPPFVLLDLSFFFCSQSEVIILFISASNMTFFLFYLVKWMIKDS